MLEVVERLLNVVGHGKMYGALFVVPVEGDSAVQCSFQVCDYYEVLF
jgi:hypothetical protein